jgi:hypothetical protein
MLFVLEDLYVLQRQRVCVPLLTNPSQRKMVCLAVDSNKRNKQLLNMGPKLVSERRKRATSLNDAHLSGEKLGRHRDRLRRKTRKKDSDSLDGVRGIVL